MNWDDLRKGIHAYPRKPKDQGGDHYGQVLRRIYDQGANLATPKMAALWPAKETWERYGSGGDDMPLPEGVTRLSTHARTEPVEVFIDFRIADFIKQNRVPGFPVVEVWLLPVFDDEEYVSWDFFFVAGTEQEALEMLEKAQCASCEGCFKTQDENGSQCV